jgi:putative transposase
VRGECLDWTLIWNRAHLHRVLSRYLEHYNTARPHRGIDLQAPIPAKRWLDAARGPNQPIERVDVLGGLIHEYRRAA